MIRVIWKYLIKIDPLNTTIEGWIDPEDKRKRPKALGNSSTIPKSKMQIYTKYVDKIRLSWTTSGKNSEVSMILGHDKQISTYIDNEDLNKKLADTDILLLVDRVQSEDVAIAGYLAGPIISEFTAFNLAEQVKSSRIFEVNKLSQVDIFEDFIALNQSNSKQKRQRKKIKAMHIRVPDKVKAQSRAALSSLFPCTVRGDYPLGTQYRFVPNTADTDFAVSPKAREIARRETSNRASWTGKHSELIISRAFINIWIVLRILQC